MKAEDGFIAGWRRSQNSKNNVPGVSWLWWNVIGCVVTFGVGYLASLAFPQVDFETVKNLIWQKNISRDSFNYQKNWNVYYAILVVWFVVILGVIAVI